MTLYLEPSLTVGLLPRRPTKIKLDRRENNWRYSAEGKLWQEDNEKRLLKLRAVQNRHARIETTWSRIHAPASTPLFVIHIVHGQDCLPASSPAPQSNLC